MFGRSISIGGDRGAPFSSATSIAIAGMKDGEGPWFATPSNYGHRN